MKIKTVWRLALVASALAWGGSPALALSLEERVACQRAVDAVHWRHRHAPGATPALPFEQAVPLAHSRRQAEDTMRKSVALDRRWGRPITAAQLQAELDRMARDSRAPEVLAELWAALGNEPEQAAECLARPALADRLIQAAFAGDDELQGNRRQRAEAEYRSARAGAAVAAREQAHRWVQDRSLALADPQGSTLLTPQAYSQMQAVLKRQMQGAQGPLPWGELGPLKEDTRRWQALAVDALDDREIRVRQRIWPKRDFDSWWQSEREVLAGAELAPLGPFRRPSAVAAATCSNDQWTPTLSGLDGRYQHGAVWTGSEMLVWGGAEATGVWFADGARYNPATDTWAPMSNLGAPSARYAFSTAWTGREMLVFGGVQDRSGGRYDPVTDTWRGMSQVGAPLGQQYSASVWTGKELIVWGGIQGVPVNTGARYNPRTNTWRTLPPSGLAPRAYMPAVWTGTEMLIWSGYDVTQGRLYRDGARFNPTTGVWTPLPVTDAPEANFYHSAVWTGQEMIVWGGSTGIPGYGRYQPAGDRWVPMSTAGAPANRYAHNAVWTGTEMLVQGGWPSRQPGGRYNPVTDSWTLMSTRHAPVTGHYSSMVWTGKEAILWGGLDENFGYHNDGGRYRPALDRWLPMTTMNVPTARAYHVAEWTGAEMLIWGGWGTLPTDRGARYTPATDSWLPMATTGQPVPRQNATSVWTGTDMIVWGGGTTNPFTPDTGGRYDPATNRWGPVSSRNAPFSTYGHSAVWTGSEMIVFGGISSSQAAKRYRPDTDTWTNATLSNEPGHRDHHAAVWTGSEMIVWGGSIDRGELGPRGGRYNPATNSWTRILRSPGQPAARAWPVGVWTGSEALFWGGYDYLYTVEFGDGGRYDPLSGQWRPISLDGAPTPRVAQGVWTGQELLLWGGEDDQSGGRYRPSTDSWTATNRQGAPGPLWGGRWSTIWTGQQMIVWGGLGPTQKGAAYCARLD